jgi:PhzF family phenazine biosynthesis protein
MKLKLFQVDAFTDKVFGGNPAAVVPLESWLPAATMQSIALENNLSETAFFAASGEGLYQLRWFTPKAEVDLCGHATLASSWVIFHHIAPHLTRVQFETRSGILTVERGAGETLRMSLPAAALGAFAAPDGFEEQIGVALGVPRPRELHIGKVHLVAVWDDAATIKAIVPGNLAPVLRSVGIWGLICTSGGETASPYDFVSRFFAPDKGVPEDPVTGSAHCALVPFWANRLDKKKLRARQISERGGDILCTDEGERVMLEATCVPYMVGEIEI